ncbi:ABC transporter permease [Pseudarthrobacter oxydans]|uniref:ABC transporter permease n=1 Tax=Pseudarthrobacter oxydans TaxID=1671 RepID=UPI00380F5C48
MTMRQLGQRAALFLALPALLVLAWWVASQNSTSFFWPPLSKIVTTFGPTWFEGRITEEVLPSLVRLALGYGIALVVGTAAGVLIGTYATLRSLLEPSLDFFRALPPPILIPIIILFLGIGDEMKVVVIAIGCVWPILLNTMEGVRGIDEVQRETASCYKLTQSSRLVHLILPGASPLIAAGARQALSIGIILMVISEMFSASNGIGFVILQFQRGFSIPEMWTGIILLGLIGLLLALIFRFVESRVLAWYYGQRNAQRGKS